MPASILVPKVFTKALCQPVEPFGLQNAAVITYKYFHEVLWCELYSVHLQLGCACGYVVLETCFIIVGTSELCMSGSH